MAHLISHCHPIIIIPLVLRTPPKIEAEVLVRNQPTSNHEDKENWSSLSNIPLNLPSKPTTQKVKCPLCDSVLSSEKVWKHHMSEKHQERKLICPKQDCGYTTSSHLRLYRHTCKPPAPSCETCGARALDQNKHNYNIHLIQKCKLCEEECVGYNKLRMHQQEVHEVRGAKNNNNAQRKKIQKDK